MWFSIKISTSNKGHSLEVMEKHFFLRKPRQAGLRIRKAFGQEGLLGPEGPATLKHWENDRGRGAAPVTFSLQMQARPQRGQRTILFILVFKKSF